MRHYLYKKAQRLVKGILPFYLFSLLPFYLFTFSPFPASAQHLQASLSHYSIDNGLCSDAIAHITHDDYGYVWLATWNGVSRFDGFNFYNYKTGNLSGVKGLHNRVDRIIIDQAQNVWLKMYDGRLFVINRQTDCIEDPLKDVNDHEDFRIDYFFSPYVSSGGDLLVSFGDVGLYKLRLDRSGLKHQHILTGSLTATCVVEGYHGDLWVGTNEGVHRMDLSNMTLEKKGYFLDESITQLVSNGYNIYAGTKSGKILEFSYGQEPSLVLDFGREITGLFIDSQGVMWFSDPGDGAYRLKLDTKNVKFYRQNVPVPEFTSRGAEFDEAMGVVWVRMNRGGFGYYNRETDEVEYFHNDPINPWNLSNTVNARLELNDGVVWESTHRRGLEKLEILKKTIERSMLVPNAQTTLENETRAMFYDEQRHLLLIGNKRGTLFLISDNGSRTTLTHDSSGESFGRFYGIGKDSKDNYWLCDKDNGLYKMTPNAGGGYTIINFRHQEGDKNSLTSNSVYQVAEDKHGNIWVATYGGGVNILVRDQEGRYKVYNRLNILKRYPIKTHQKVRTIALDGEGNIWAGTTDGILIMSLQGDDFKVSALEAPEEMEKGLASNDIMYLAADRSGSMWIGTNGGGLSHAIEKDSKGHWEFKNYGVQDGLPSEEIRSMTFDNKGNVWFATDHILCSYDVKKDIFTTFSNLDGVDDTMCSEGAACALSNGNILFGTINGYYIVDRNKLTTKTGSLLKLRITDFFVNGELQSPRLNDTFGYYVPESKRVELPGNNMEFAFRFASLNYQYQHRIHYQYRLEGYDNEWHNADKSRMATYSDLPAGNYRFQVKAFLLESPDNYDMRTIEVVVPAFFLLSTTAIWIYLLLLGGTAVGLLLWYQNRQLRQHMKDAPPPNFNDLLETGDRRQEPASESDIAEGTDEYEIIEELRD